MPRARSVYTPAAFMISMVEDRTLISAAQRGDIGAFRRLIADYDADVLGLALKIAATEEEARRLYLDTMLRVHQELPGFRYECAFHVWVCRHFCAVSVDYLKRKRVRRKAGIDGALDRLMPSERMAVELKHYLRESLETIGEMLGMTKEAAGDALVRGIQKLGISFDEHNPSNL